MKRHRLGIKSSCYKSQMKMVHNNLSVWAAGISGYHPLSKD